MPAVVSAGKVVFQGSSRASRQQTTMPTKQTTSRMTIATGPASLTRCLIQSCLIATKPIAKSATVKMMSTLSPPSKLPSSVMTAANSRYMAGNAGQTLVREVPSSEGLAMLSVVRMANPKKGMAAYHAGAMTTSSTMRLSSRVSSSRV